VNAADKSVILLKVGSSEAAAKAAHDEALVEPLGHVGPVGELGVHLDPDGGRGLDAGLDLRGELRREREGLLGEDRLGVQPEPLVDRRLVDLRATR
jgi:hypothetical protein